MLKAPLWETVAFDPQREGVPVECSTTQSENHEMLDVTSLFLPAAGKHYYQYIQPILGDVLNVARCAPKKSWPAIGQENNWPRNPKQGEHSCCSDSSNYVQIHFRHNTLSPSNNMPSLSRAFYYKKTTNNKTP